MWDLKYTLDSRHIQDVIVYSLGDRHRSITENINGGFTLNQWDYHHFTYSNMLFGRYTLVSDEPMSKICWMSHADPVELAVPPFRSEGHDGGQQPGACHDVVRGTFLRCCTAKTMSRKLRVKNRVPRATASWMLDTSRCFFAAKIKRITGKNGV